MSYNTKNYAAHGGNEWVVGGKLTILEGATVTGITAAAAAASGEALGGVKADTKSVQDTVEVKIGADNKLYVPTYPQSYTLPEAAEDDLGGVMLAENQADSTASTVAGLKDDLNALLAKLKACGVMAADTPIE
ncbi:MAG: head fiber protein [Eubacteriales bacterium]|nr:head fiber protein [Eubacteriales bacterium]MDD4513893.1 head fiber protein [Eubacteriales bacterium]